MLTRKLQSNRFKNRLEFEQVILTISDNDLIEQYLSGLMILQESTEIESYETKFNNGHGLNKSDAPFYTHIYALWKLDKPISKDDMEKLRYGRKGGKCGGIGKYWGQLQNISLNRHPSHDKATEDETVKKEGIDDVTHQNLEKFFNESYRRMNKPEDDSELNYRGQKAIQNLKLKFKFTVERATHIWKDYVKIRNWELVE
ncbi:hypothetical protein BROC_00218 [Candidatus Brocadiaceae bacterium]|nr:hypothetical protein BROC_00218 [Candidatus Brocadiaceae bacterium]